jgi:hypothetical protein
LSNPRQLARVIDESYAHAARDEEAQPMQLNSDVEESNRQFREAWSLYARASRGGDVFDRDGLTVMNANHPWFFLNVGILNAPVVDERDLVRRAQAALTYFGGRANPRILTGSEDWFGPGAKAVLSRLGIAHKLDLMGMVAEKLHPPIRPLPDVEVQAIADEETRVALADLNADCYAGKRSREQRSGRGASSEPWPTWTARRPRERLRHRSRTRSTSGGWRPRRAIEAAGWPSWSCARVSKPHTGQPASIAQSCTRPKPGSPSM